MTTTTTTTTTTAPVPDYVAAATLEACVKAQAPYRAVVAALPAGDQAVLPYALLHAAAQLASSDPAKQLLGAVHVRPAADDALIIEATNGNIACRFRFGCSPEGVQLWRSGAESLLLPAALLRKRTAYAQFVAVTPDGLTLLGGRFAKKAEHPPAEFLQGLPRWVGAPLAGQYPAMDALWPNAFENAPGKPVCMAADYLGTIAAAARLVGGDDYGRCNLQLSCNGAVQPVVWELHNGPQVWGCQGGAAEFLLMPVQVRR